MKKVLFVATITRTINAFLIPYLKMFKEQGYEVHVASNGDEQIEYCDKHFNIQFARFPIKPSNLKAYKELKKIINENEYEIIHCHTPVAGVLTRLAARKARKNGSKVFYTAHGFHFYKGAPVLNWIIYYPIEKICARWTDCLITINSEDYERAKRKFKKCKRIEYISGIGFDINKFNISLSEIEKKELRNLLGLNREDYVIIFPARLDKNKNQILLINALELIIKEYNNIHLLLPGRDEYRGVYQKIVKEKKLNNNIHFLGKRNDIERLMQISNLAVSTSIREGFGLNIVEALFCNIPVIATNNRGHREIIENGVNGFLIDFDPNVLCRKIIDFYNGKIKLDKIQESSLKFSIYNILLKMEKIYNL